MKQALHIFRKDVRHLWPVILLVLLLAAANAVFFLLSSPLETVQTARLNQIYGVLRFLLVLSWLYLIAVSVFHESLPGDTQFWVTWPYSRVSLLAAKLLFALAFFNLPLLLSDCFLLAFEHLPIVIPALAARQLELTVLIVLPALVVATLTRNVAQFVLSLLAALLGLIGVSLLLSPGSGGVSVAVGTPGWASNLLPIALGLAVIVWQYFMRRSGVARITIILGLFVVLPALSTLRLGPPPQRFMGFIPKIHQQFNPASLGFEVSQDAPVACADDSSSHPMSLPLHITGLPAGVALIGSGEGRVTGPHIQLRANEVLGGYLNRVGQDYCFSLRLPADNLDTSVPQSGVLHATLYLTALNDIPSLRVPAALRHIQLSRFAYCERAGSHLGEYLICTSGPYLLAPMAMSIQSAQFNSDPLELSGIHEIKAANEGLSPIDRTAFPLDGVSRKTGGNQARAALHDPRAEFVFTPLTPLGYGRKEVTFSFQDLRQFVDTRAR